MEIRSWLASALVDPRCTFSMGAFGAIAGFSADEGGSAVERNGDVLTTIGRRSAISLKLIDGLTAIAFETLSSNAASWNHGVALCLPDRRTGGARKRIAELGEDGGLLGSGRLFDLGLGLSQADICVRAREGPLADGLRSHLGSDSRADLGALAALLAVYAHTRVTITLIGRIETTQAAGDGPLQHPSGIIPQLLGSSRTHPATTPIPSGLVPYGYVFPAHPLRRQLGEAKPFDSTDHAAFQSILSAFGVPEAKVMKARVIEALTSDAQPTDFPLPADRFSSTCLRVTLRQMRYTHPSADLAPWLARFDAPAAKAASED